jgi:hypothetical protein
VDAEMRAEWGVSDIDGVRRGRDLRLGTAVDQPAPPEGRVTCGARCDSACSEVAVGWSTVAVRWVERRWGFRQNRDRMFWHVGNGDGDACPSYRSISVLSAWKN